MFFFIIFKEKIIKKNWRNIVGNDATIREINIVLLFAITILSDWVIHGSMGPSLGGKMISQMKISKRYKFAFIN